MNRIKMWLANIKVCIVNLLRLDKKLKQFLKLKVLLGLES